MASKVELQSMVTALIPAARDAGAAIMDVYGRDARAETKDDGSPVTEADRAAEKIILGALSVAFPHVPVVSEENAASHDMEAPDCFFLVDPLDGTREFLRRDGKGSFTVNIALIDHGRPVLGIVFAPALDRLFAGSAATGAVEIANGVQRPIRVRAVPRTGAVAVASLSHRDAETDAWLSENQISETVSIGSSLKFCLLACGEADVYPRFGPTMEWDTAAGDAVLRAAGGSVVAADGALFAYGKPGFRNGPFIARGNAA